MIETKQNPKIQKLEAEIAKNNKTIMYHQEKIDILLKSNESLKKDVDILKNEDMLNLLSTKNLSFEKLAKLIDAYSDEPEKDEGDTNTDYE